MYLSLSMTIFWSMAISHLVYPFISWWIFGLFPQQLLCTRLLWTLFTRVQGFVWAYVLGSLGCTSRSGTAAWNNTGMSMSSSSSIKNVPGQSLEPSPPVPVRDVKFPAYWPEHVNRWGLQFHRDTWGVGRLDRQHEYNDSFLKTKIVDNFNTDR